MKIMYEHMVTECVICLNTLSEDKFEIIQRVWPGKKGGVVISPFICFNALGKS